MCVSSFQVYKENIRVNFVSITEIWAKMYCKVTTWTRSKKLAAVEINYFATPTLVTFLRLDFGSIDDDFDEWITYLTPRYAISNISTRIFLVVSWTSWYLFPVNHVDIFLQIWMHIFCLFNLRLDIPTFKLIPDFADLNLIGLGRYLKLNLVLMSDHRQCILGSWLSFVCFYLCMSA